VLNNTLGDLTLLIYEDVNNYLVEYAADAWAGILTYVWWSLNILEQEEEEKQKAKNKSFLAHQQLFL
jgi:hypothetical protein